MKNSTTGRRLLAALALATACTTGAVGVVGAAPSAAEAAPVTATPSGEWQFEFTATHYVTLSCYFEKLDRTDATGPFKYTGSGKNKQAAEKAAWNKAQAAVPQGQKVKHCRTEKAWKR